MNTLNPCDAADAAPTPRLVKATGWWISSLLFAAGAWFATNGAGLSSAIVGAGVCSVAIGIFVFATHRRLIRIDEVLQTLAVITVLGISAHPDLTLWTVSNSLAQAFSLSRFGALLFIFVYFLATTATHSARRCCLTGAESFALLSIPYLFGWALLLASPAPAPELFNILPQHIRESAVGLPLVRMMILCALNLFVVVLITSITSKRWIPRSDAIQLSVFAALFAALTPIIADLGVAPPLVNGWHEYPLAAQSLWVIFTTALAQAGLWGQTFLVTGFLMDALGNRPPAFVRGKMHFMHGVTRGAVYSGVFLTILHGANLFTQSAQAMQLLANYPLLIGTLLGALLFPLIKTVVESFDGSQPFITRLSRSHSDALNYVRGAIFGFGVTYALVTGMQNGNPTSRAFWGALIGALTFAGVHVVRDFWEVRVRHRSRIQPWNVYGVEVLLGGFTGLALGWYCEASQLQVIIDKFNRYIAIQTTPEPYVIYPLFSKWGALDLGTITSGGRLLFLESLSGVVSWSLAAPLFSINLVFLTALLKKTLRPIRELFTAHGFARMVSEALRVERWGLWMAPIIYSFLRMSAEPTWYNQDGAIRTVVATAMSFSLDPADFRTWSLELFVSMLAVDWLRVLIWFDHMGLRVATLVNFSFIGGDMLDEKAARMMGHSAPSRCIPEGLRRFGTWMPLLIPFYIPRGGDWDYAWDKAATIAQANAASAHPAALWLAGFFLLTGAAIGSVQLRKPKPQTITNWARRSIRLTNEHYSLELSADGRGWSEVYRSPASGDKIDLTRKPESLHALAGKTFYIAERNTAESCRAWSIHRSPAPASEAKYSTVVRETSLHFVCENGTLRIESDVHVDDEDPIEIWDIKLQNRGDLTRSFELVSFRDLVVNGTGVSQRHPSFNDIHVSTCFVPELQAIFASNRLLLDNHHRPGKGIYFHAAAPLPTGVSLIGYEDSRAALIGETTERAPQGIFAPGRPITDAGKLYPFDPIASLRIAITLAPGATVSLRFAEGWALKPSEAATLLARHLRAPRVTSEKLREIRRQTRTLHSHLQKSTPHVPWQYAADGKTLSVTPHTPRPWAHPLANKGGYGALVTNEGASFSFCENAQQNPITPFVLGPASGVTPGQSWYLWDCEEKEQLFSLPLRLNDPERTPQMKTVFGRGFVSHQLSAKNIDAVLTSFVLPDAPVEGRILELKNTGNKPLKLRLSTCMRFSLAEIPWDSRGHLSVSWNATDQLFFAENPKQEFKRGPAFIAPGFAVEHTETVYRHFVGRGRTAAHPIMAELGKHECSLTDDGYRAAAMSTIVEIAAGETKTLGLVMGQATNSAEALAYAQQYRSIAALQKALEETTAWWEEFLGVLRVETEDPGFDRLVNDWLPYQVVTARLWGRTGPYQRSGAFGFRDQLQDVIPLASTHPDLSRRQILLHAAQQFREGDTMQWWHFTWEGKTGIGARNRASDVMLWLPHVVLRYIEATGDSAILDEEVTFLEGKPIPRHYEGIVFAPRDTHEPASLYEHCRRSIDWVTRSLGEHGLPRMGAGDWNDGLDAIGKDDRGESVWLGFFLHGVLKDFAAIAATREGEAAGKKIEQTAAALRTSLKAMWREKRFVRAVNHEGIEILYDDALTSSWPAMTEAVEDSIATVALEHGMSALERETIMLLLAPTFDEKSSPYPGRISVYPPGVRENGGQYSHGSSWLVDSAMALAGRAAARGEKERAAHLRKLAANAWYKISPLSQTTAEQWERYGLEPHQQPADIYFAPGYEGRGGWSWYTGSAARMVSAAWALVGVSVKNGELSIAPWTKDAENWPKLRSVTFKGKKHTVK